MKIIKEVTAYQYDCPYQPNACKGKNCMAWCWQPIYETYQAGYNTRLPVSPPVFKKYSEELGYCGSVKG